jgi:cellulose synthase/poly-beta-1,6-N-acetylglucosamine synthase-like glycosyltransferase
VILPCRNEVRFLSACLDSILASEYPAPQLEIVVADGMSTDGTRDLIANYHRAFPNVRLIDNSAGVTPAGLNRAIEVARGEIIVRLDAHSTIAPDYVLKAVGYLQRYAADNVGGVMRTVARDRGCFANAIRAALSHPFGVGNSHFRTGHDELPRQVDTVFGGCWRREVFDRVGKFNEQLARGQDMEFNLRLARAGGRILLAPDMRSYYFARATYLEFVKHNWSNGVWAVLPFAYSEVLPVRIRHLIPLGFVATLVVATVLAAIVAWWIPLLILAPYFAGTITATLATSARERDLGLLWTLPVAFATLHFAYGSGSAWGALKLLAIFTRRALLQPRAA